MFVTYLRASVPDWDFRVSVMYAAWLRRSLSDGYRRDASTARDRSLREWSHFAPHDNFFFGSHPRDGFSGLDAQLDYCGAGAAFVLWRFGYGLDVGVLLQELA